MLIILQKWFSRKEGNRPNLFAKTEMYDYLCKAILNEKNLDFES